MTLRCQDCRILLRRTRNDNMGKKYCFVKVRLFCKRVIDLQKSESITGGRYAEALIVF